LSYEDQYHIANKVA